MCARRYRRSEAEKLEVGEAEAAEAAEAVANHTVLLPAHVGLTSDALEFTRGSWTVAQRAA
jgi:ketopantoate hydroxymethyltransferase